MCYFYYFLLLAITWASISQKLANAGTQLFFSTWACESYLQNTRNFSVLVISCRWLICFCRAYIRIFNAGGRASLFVTRKRVPVLSGSRLIFFLNYVGNCASFSEILCTRVRTFYIEQLLLHLVNSVTTKTIISIFTNVSI